MAIEKLLNSRIQHKHDVEENWEKAVNFIPKEGEFIIYDPDDRIHFYRIKIGDGSTPVGTLPFFMVEEVSDLIESLANETLTVKWENNSLLFDKGVTLTNIMR